VVRRKYRAVLIDFGATRSRNYLEAWNRGETLEGLAPQITPFYAPPEAVVESRRPGGELGHVFHPSLDVYAAALVIYAMVTGHPPYSHLKKAVNPHDLESVIAVKSAERRGEIETIAQETIRRVIFENTKFVGSDREAFDLALYKFLLKRLDPDPEVRGSARDMKRDFERLAKIRSSRSPGSEMLAAGAARVFLPFQAELVEVGTGEHPLMRAARACGIDAQDGDDSDDQEDPAVDPNAELDWLDDMMMEDGGVDLDEGAAQQRPGSSRAERPPVPAPPRRRPPPPPGRRGKLTRNHGAPSDRGSPPSERIRRPSSERSPRQSGERKARPSERLPRPDLPRRRAGRDDPLLKTTERQANYSNTRRTPSDKHRRGSASDRVARAPGSGRAPRASGSGRVPKGEKSPRPKSDAGRPRKSSERAPRAELPADAAPSVNPVARGYPSKEQAEAPHCLLSPVLDAPLLLSREKRYFVGRDPSMDVRIKSDLVSRRHAQVHFDGSGFVLTDLGSLNGTSINNSRLSAPCPLHDEDRISFGGFEFAVRVLRGEDWAIDDRGGTSRIYKGSEDLTGRVTPALAGNLGQLQLRDILEVIDWKKHSGTLEIQPDGASQGYIYFVEGKPVHSTVKGGEGLEPCLRLLETRRGRFAFTHGKPRCPRTIEHDLDGLWRLVAKRESGG
jgi:pSer/pThr/pTyr-binding forkhead associated (FHA) protein